MRSILKENLMGKKHLKNLVVDARIELNIENYIRKTI
jgi:hypothetical protein